jgi:redox-sensitive bicupin YhaK (pirin superfamily)
MAAVAVQTPSVRPVETLHRPPGLHMVGDGFRVHGYFSVIPRAVQRLSPFLLLDYHPAYVYSPTERPRGVGVHPHRGFETVTLAWQGSVAHHDSTGNGGVIGPGDVQWMTAASGILHKEYHEREFSRRGGAFQMAQLWVNLPRKHKLGAPGYQGITADRIRTAELPGGSVRVIAGDYAGTRGAARTFTPISLFDVRVKAGGTVPLELPAEHNLGLLLMEGDLTTSGRELKQHDFAVFGKGESVALSSEHGAHVLVMGGAPIDEPVVPYGPFVMNSEREIVEAIQDFNDGKFGHLED